MLINPLGIKDEKSMAFCIHITMNKKEIFFPIVQFWGIYFS